MIYYQSVICLVLNLTGDKPSEVTSLQTRKKLCCCIKKISYLCGAKSGDGGCIVLQYKNVFADSDTRVLQ